MQNLKNRNAVVTGAARGIGEKIAHALANEGMNIVLVDRLEKELDQVRAAMEEKGVKAGSLVADIGTYEACADVLKQSEERVGEIDVLVNNAGLG